MYDELVKQLRELQAITEHCGEQSCDECENRELCDKHDNKTLSGTYKEAADAIEELQKAVNFHKFNSEFWEDKYNTLADEKWIPVTERLPDTGVDVLVKFPHNMAVASIDIGEWVVNSGDGWCTDINLAGGEKNPTHWMPLPQPPEEE